MDRYYPEDTIAAVSTPIGEGGIGIVRLSGPRALEIVDDIFVSKDGRKPSQYKTYTVHYGHIVDNGPNPYSLTPNPKFIDEVLLTVMRAPRSYTKEDIVEINCHGGIQAVKKVLELVVRCGARIAEPGEFTKRAFLNGRLDLAQAEAVLDMINARTEGSLKVAASQLGGELSRHVSAIRDEIAGVASHVEASIDFPEEGLEIVEEKALVRKIGKVIAELKGLIDTADEGIVLREGVLAIICGKPNVGKSSLMNLLLKRDRVIVSPIPGTTRDAVEEVINLKGIPIRLVDTAGIIRTGSALEEEAVKKSKSYLELADLALLVLDASSEMDAKDSDIIKLTQDKNRLVVINKIDLDRKIDKGALKNIFKKESIVEVSVEKKENIELLEKAILDMIWSGNFSQGEGAIVTNARHKDLLDKTYDCMLSVGAGLKEGRSPELIAIDLREAVFNLGLVTGRSVSDDILDRIFKEFCVGK